jgi:hypothetical protein
MYKNISKAIIANANLELDLDYSVAVTFQKVLKDYEVL